MIQVLHFDDDVPESKGNHVIDVIIATSQIIPVHDSKVILISGMLNHPMIQPTPLQPTNQSVVDTITDMLRSR
jgi:hypothetical protein